MPFVSRISRAKQNCEIKGHEYQLQAKIEQNYYSISNCMVLIHQNKGAKIILHAKSPTFWAAQLKGFTVSHKPGGRLLLLSTKPGVTFPVKNITPLAGTTGVSSLPKVTTQWCPAVSYTHLTLPTNREV